MRRRVTCKVLVPRMVLRVVEARSLVDLSALVTAHTEAKGLMIYI